MLKGYWLFARYHPRFIGFGFFMALLSSPGQTFFIGVFGHEISAEFGLSPSYWGQIYMVGTLLSAAVITWSGALIDRFDLRWFSCATLLSLAAACLFISMVATLPLLILAIFSLRQFGQGLTSHISNTSMARYFPAERGKALALAAMGYSAGEAVLT